MPAGTTIDAVLSHLEGVRGDGNGGYLALCPCHDDHAPSLHIWTDEAGQLAYCCLAGCEHREVSEKLGISPPADDEWTPHGPAIAEYRYTDEQGRHLFSVCRTADKQFPCWQPDPTKPHGKAWSLKGARRVLYRLPRVLASAVAGETVYVVEGEKDVHALERAGTTATCNPSGAGKWRHEYSAALAGAHVVIIADRDEPGRKHAAQVAASLAGIAANTSIVEAATGKDVYDHLAAGKTVAELVPVDLGDAATAEAPTPDATPLEDLSDAGNAAVFVRLMGDRVRYVALWNAWAVYDGRRWTPDTTRLVESLMGEALLTRFQEAAQAPDVDASKKIAAWAASSRSAAKLRAALEVARSDRRIAAHPADFDRDLYLFNCLNGTIDLRTGQLHPHDPCDLLTKTAPVAFDPAARSDLWERVLAEATEADEALQITLQRLAGYVLTGDTREEVFFILHGPEATMKSTLTEALAAAMGDYAQTAEQEVFLARTHVGGPRDDVAGMEGARLVVCAEFDRGRKMAEALLKQLTGGDTVRARHLYQASREFRFTAKLVFHTNTIPRMSDDDGAVWRRVWIVSFRHTVPEGKRDTSVKARLTDPDVSGAAILAWAVRGCLDWQAHGLGKPPAVAEATRAVRLSMDRLAEFFEERCAFEPCVWTPSRELQRAYEEWATDSHRPKIGPKEWGQRLSTRGLRSVKRHGVRGWLGVCLLDAESVEAALDFDDEPSEIPPGSVEGSVGEPGGRHGS